MNYRHAYHAGNHADVLKHLVLSRIFALMVRKDTPFAFLDSHSGIGLYDLQGSQDRVHLNELHPEDGRLLKANMGGERRIAVHQNDGWLLPRALLPVQEKRGVLLIDPPFEEADELERCVIALEEAIGRMRQTVVAIWYPIKDERQLKRFYQGLERSKAPKLLRVELLVHPADSADRLNGSGLAIANPPWPLEEELRELLPWLAEVLAQSEGGWRLDWLVEEGRSS